MPARSDVVFLWRSEPVVSLTRDPRELCSVASSTCAPRGALFTERMKGPAVVLSQQDGEAEGSLTLETQGRVGSSPDKDGTGRNYQTARVRQARRKGVTQVNQWLNPLKEATGSNRVDVGRAATHAGCRFLRSVTPKPVSCAGGEATRNACGVLVARLQGNSWAPTPSIGTR